MSLLATIVGRRTDLHPYCGPARNRLQLSYQDCRTDQLFTFLVARTEVRDLHAVAVPVVETCDENRRVLQILLLDTFGVFHFNSEAAAGGGRLYPGQERAASRVAIEPR